MRPIDADAMIDRLKEWDTKDKTDKALYNFTLNRINEQPTIQPEPHWIPCSERLPKDFEEVNVTWVNHDPEPYYDFTKDVPFTATAVYLKGKWYWYSSVCTDILREYGNNHPDEMDSAIEVTAWMPLPEPYKTKSEEV